MSTIVSRPGAVSEAPAGALPSRTPASGDLLSSELLPVLSGYAPALPTPFDRTGAVDTGAFERLCDLQIEAGATALVVCGTTGEAPTLTPAEHHRLVRSAVDVAAGRVPVVAGAGSNATACAIALARDAEEAEADAVLSVVPYYNKPTQAGLLAHFRAIAHATALPIILYDVPGRTGCALADDTVVRLAELPQIVGLKDATGDVGRLARLRPRLGRDFRLLSGDDATAPAFLAQGGDGCISVVSNLMPGLCRELFEAGRAGEAERARALAEPIVRLAEALFAETSPAPLKYALSLLGLTSPAVRLPLVPPRPALRETLDGLVAGLRENHRGQIVGA